MASPFIYIKIKKPSVSKTRNIIITNVLCFFSVLLLSLFSFTKGYAEPVTEASKSVTEVIASGGNGNGPAYIAAALSTGLACIGTGIAVASASSASLGAISEDPKIMGKSLIFLALAEGVALYGLIISFIILNKI